MLGVFIIIFLAVEDKTAAATVLCSLIVDFYSEGFSGMSDWAKSLWIIILIKLFVMFFILKLFFFRDTLKNQFDNDQQRGEHVIEQITK